MTTTRRIADAIMRFFSGKKSLFRVLAIAAVPAVVALVPNAAGAADCSWYDIPCHAAHFLTWFFEILTALMGYIIVLLVDGIIRVASYDNFVAPGPTAVRFGWVITRDLSNMFFIVFLLIIAFATIIGYEKYAYRSNLRRLLIMAVVINFSKTICGLFIDMSQVLLLSFVNGFKAAAAGNFLRAFQIEKLLKLADGESSYTFGLVLAMMFAFMLAAIAACVMLVLLVILLFRIIMLWVLIILSPIAFLTSSFPLGSENYYAKWWGMLKANLTNGPVIAFFIWLALATAQQTGGNLSSPSEGWGNPSAVAKQETTAAGTVKIGSTAANIPSAAGTTDTILSMIIMICILFAGLKFASEAQVMGSGFAKSVRGKAEGYLRRPWTAPGVSQAVGAAGGAFRSTGGRAMSRVGAGLARVPIVGGLGRRMALTGEKLEEGRRKELEAKTGGARELAKYSPGQFGSTHRLRTASDGQIEETAAIAAGDPKAMENLQKYGGMAFVRDRLKKLADKDPSKKGAYDSFMKANWQGAVDDKGEMTPDARAAVLKKHTGDDAKKFIAAEDFNEEVATQLSGPALTEYLNNGKPDQQKKAAEVLDAMAAGGTLEPLLKDKRMSYSNISAETLKAAGAGADNLRKGALAAAEKDPSLMKKFADDPKMRDELATTARANFSSVATDIEKVQKLATLTQLGSATDADFGTPPAGSPPGTSSNIEQAIGQISLKQLNEMERSTPTDDSAAQANLARIINSALKHGSSEMAQAILRSPALSQRADLTLSREAVKSTSGYTSNLNSSANSKIADLDRQRRAAPAGTTGGPGGLDAQLAGLRTAVQAVKSAMNDLATEEEHLVTEQENFAAAQKSGNAASASAAATAISASLGRVAAKRQALATENSNLKALT